MEAEPKEHRLFHYTSQFQYLQDMIGNGIWPRFCVEEFDWLLDHFTCMAFPVACFCDIPLPAAKRHRGRYGDYAIAFPKQYASDYDINPVWYIQEGTSVEAHLRNAVVHRVRVTLDTIPPLIKPLLPFLKSAIGAQPDRGATRPGTLEILPFEEELEWRYTPPALIDAWKFGYDRDIVEALDNEISKGLRVHIHPDHLDSVYVTSGAEHDELLYNFPFLNGKVVVW